MSDIVWASDVPVSLPEPPEETELSVRMYGFVFTENGFFHDITEADHEALRRPTYGPVTDPTTVEYGDGG